MDQDDDSFVKLMSMICCVDCKQSYLIEDIDEKQMMCPKGHYIGE